MEQPLQDLGARPPPRIARDEGGEAIAADDAVADRADAADDETRRARPRAIDDRRRRVERLLGIQREAVYPRAQAQEVAQDRQLPRTVRPGLEGQGVEGKLLPPGSGAVEAQQYLEVAGTPDLEFGKVEASRHEVPVDVGEVGGGQDLGDNVEVPLPPPVGGVGGGGGGEIIDEGVPPPALVEVGVAEVGADERRREGVVPAPIPPPPSPSSRGGGGRGGIAHRGEEVEQSRDSPLRPRRSRRRPATGGPPPPRADRGGRREDEAKGLAERGRRPGAGGTEV